MALELDKAILGLYPDMKFQDSDQPETFWIGDDGNGPYIKAWNSTKPQPQVTDIRRGWFLYQQRKAGARARARMTEFMSKVVPEGGEAAESVTVEEVNRKVEALYLLLTDVLISLVDDPPKKAQIRNARDQMRTKRQQIAALTPADPNNADYLALAEQVKQIVPEG